GSRAALPRRSGPQSVLRAGNRSLLLLYPRSRSSNVSAEATVARGVRPRPVAAATMRVLGHPHLLERRPAVRPAPPEQHARSVRAHEAAVHLQSAPVRVAGVAPVALEPVNAEPAGAMRRMRRQPADRARL